MSFAVQDVTLCRDCPFPMKLPTLGGAGPEVPFPLSHKMSGFNIGSLTDDQKTSEIGQASEVIQLTIIKVEGPFQTSAEFAVLAVGAFSSGGWKEAFISPRVHVAPPDDGIYEFDLVAERPQGRHTMILSYLATLKLWHFPDQAKGLRVYSAGDKSKVALFV